MPSGKNRQFNIDPMRETGRSLFDRLGLKDNEKWGLLEYDIHSELDSSPLKSDVLLAHQNIDEGSVILVRKLFLGGGGEYGFDFNGLRNPITESFSDSAPSYRTIAPGISFKSECKTSTCIAYNQVIYVNRGFGDNIDVGVESVRLQCPVCGNKSENALNCGFYAAQYQFKGVTSEGEDVQFGDICQKNEYYTFEEREKVHWIRLLVNVWKSQYAPRSIFK